MQNGVETMKNGTLLQVSPREGAMTSLGAFSYERLSSLFLQRNKWCNIDYTSGPRVRRPTSSASIQLLPEPRVPHVLEVSDC